MKITDVPFAVLRFQYQFVRFPLQLIEDRVITRMDSEAPGRLLYERSFGSLDAAIGGVLGDSELAERGAALAKRSDVLARAARLDGAATQKEKRADEALKAKRDQALEDLDAAHETKQREVDDAAAAADDRRRAAVDEARKQAADVKQTADEVAARRTRSAETTKSEEQRRIRAAEQAQTAAADAKLKDAQEKRRKAASTRAQADRVEQLAEQEKEKRQSERATNS
ncbi:MAG: hypothetical protein QOK02_5997 [Mycobacterium sp.]|jgi:hypothetical protein|nr:hypothetical protein [Mycobacterium sp.]